MSTATSAILTRPTPYAALPPFPVRRFTVEEYLRMIETEVLTEKDQVELLDGWIFPKMARNAPHDKAIMKINRRLTARLPSTFLLYPQCALVLAESVPEPDFSIVEGTEDEFGERPEGQDVSLLIEVADSSLDYDREEKAPLYAEAGIPIYWIINIPEAQVEVYSAPSGPADEPSYGKRRDFQPGSTVPLLLKRKIVARIPVTELLP